MGALCCCARGGTTASAGDTHGDHGAIPYVLSAHEKEALRARRAEAAEARRNNFKQGGGGERLKEQTERREQAQRDAAFTGQNAMQWGTK
ncbi:hypothetical protein Naga_100281g1 [Nannochloropsis gaditana]|uniref:Small VCP/p97-interacting protein n=1 Tax=Nannochloropsis gaditana TaxID=72520 RepID=W7TY43_9STRA|nr:hypothetical protein Naga_100281g1 [Nannochloropsis gaditana]